ncbi:MAG: ubiquinol-cytochrome C chaperone family protein [Kiloniellales bacterium]
MIFSRLFRPDPNLAPAHALYEALVAQARQPGFYRDWEVPDTLDGRFELVTLHTFLLLHRLKVERAASADLAQALFDILFADMDQSLRELGVGDLGVGPRIKTMAEAFYGRIAAYQEVLEGPGGNPEAALARNLYGTMSASPASLAAMAGYLRAAALLLAEQQLDALAAGRAVFPRVPAPGAASEGVAP